MLPELLLTLTTPCPNWARRFGYLEQAVRFWARQRRCALTWQPHLANCRTLILEAAALCPRRGRAVVLGSGLLIELPLAELAAQFDEVLLVDAVHLVGVRRTAARYPSVRLATLDLAGVFDRPDGPAFGLDGLPPPEPPVLPGGRCDLAISANLLSQLPFLPCEALERRLGPGRDADLEAFARGLILAHLAWLKRLADVTCLYTDTVSTVCSADTVVETEDQLYGVALPPPDRRWHWQIAPHPEEFPDLDRQNRMAGYRRFSLEPALPEAAIAIETAG
ncbi:MAG: hypothetical protein GC191_05845 [Azospirillum sp.]|nr:hypothetical protein [Azospirillum sp.]